MNPRRGSVGRDPPVESFVAWEWKDALVEGGFKIVQPWNAAVTVFKYSHVISNIRECCTHVVRSLIAMLDLPHGKTIWSVILTSAFIFHCGKWHQKISIKMNKCSAVTNEAVLIIRLFGRRSQGGCELDPGQAISSEWQARFERAAH